MPVVLALIIAVLAFVLLIKLMVVLVAVLICAGLAGFIFLAAQRLIGQGR